MAKEYSNGELTIVWDPEKCIHSGICVQTLPEVYNPKEKPWIKQDNATTEQLVRQIDNCPSGALSYYFNQNEENGVFRDNPEKKRFELVFEGKTAFLEYIKAKDNMYLTHTEVPREIEGRGIGSRIILQGLVEVKKTGLKLVPLCPFVAVYLKRHPEWKELVWKGVNIA